MKYQIDWVSFLFLAAIAITAGVFVHLELYGAAVGIMFFLWMSRQ